MVLKRRLLTLRKWLDKLGQGIKEKDLDKRFDRIRSFVLRAGRTTVGQQRAIDELGPQFLIPFQEAPLNLQGAFAGSTNSKIRINFKSD